MGGAADILDHLAAIKAKGEPFALATVVRTVAATAAKAGAKAVILPDGTISEGWMRAGHARPFAKPRERRLPTESRDWSPCSRPRFCKTRALRPATSTQAY